MKHVENVLINMIVFLFFVTLNHYTIDMSATWATAGLISFVSIVTSDLIIRLRDKANKK